MHTSPGDSECSVKRESDEASAPPAKIARVAEASAPADPGLVSLSSLLTLDCEALLRIRPPSATNSSQLSGLQMQQVSPLDRMQLLERQADVWADDELQRHLQCICDRIGPRRRPFPPGFNQVVPIAPLRFVSWLAGYHDDLRSFFRAQRIASGFVTVAWLNGHWFPALFWPCVQRFNVFIWDNASVDHAPVRALCRVIASELLSPEPTMQVSRHGFDPTLHCGALAIGFLRHLLLGETLLYNATFLRPQFLDHLATTVSCPKPWFWGRGSDNPVLVPLKQVLLEQGVGALSVDERAAAVRSLGSAVIDALKSKNVWRSLKTAGTKVKFQFLTPSEIATKTQSGQKAFNRKVQPTKHRVRGQEDSISLDPSKLVLQPGAFHSADKEVEQIPVEKLGPLATGVALALAHEVEPFLVAGQVVSKSPLGVLILHGPNQAWRTVLPQTQVTVPCRCAVDQEPVLAQASLVQLGTGHIECRLAARTVSVDTLDVATVKLLIYRDEVSTDWDVCAQAPMKYVVGQFPLLKLCKESPCDCPCWHDAEQTGATSALRRRQYLRLNFKPAKASDATLFTVCIRVPSCLVIRLLGLSGVGGIYLEPRTLDGKEVSTDWVVIWIPKMPRSGLLHLKQTNPAAIGFARVGDRFGLRVPAGQAQLVHQQVRPGSVFLPAGPRVSYVIV